MHLEKKPISRSQDLGKIETQDLIQSHIVRIEFEGFIEIFFQNQAAAKLDLMVDKVHNGVFCKLQSVLGMWEEGGR